MYIHIYQRCTRNGTEPARGHDFGTDRPSQDQNGDHSEPNWTRPDRLWRGAKQTVSMRNGSIFGLDRTGPDRTGPDQTGLDRTGPDTTGPDQTDQDLNDCCLEGNGRILCR